MIKSITRSIVPLTPIISLIMAIDMTKLSMTRTMTKNETLMMRK